MTVGTGFLIIFGCVGLYIWLITTLGIGSGPQDSREVERQLTKQVNILQNDRWDRQSRLGKDYWSPNPLKKD